MDSALGRILVRKLEEKLVGFIVAMMQRYQENCSCESEPFAIVKQRSLSAKPVLFCWESPNAEASFTPGTRSPP